MRILILGFGVIGGLVAQRLLAAGHQVRGVRRTAGPAPAGVDLHLGDAGDAQLLESIGPVDAVLLAANPGIRRGRDNGLARIAEQVAQRYKAARAVYTSTTSLYGDAQGAGVAEDGAVADTPEARALLAIETAFLRHPRALVLRATAIIGPTRTHVRERLVVAHGGELTVKGDLDRPFSYIHEDDLAEVCVHALLGGLGSGVLNVAAPHVITVRDYYRHQAAAAGVNVVLRSNGTAVASRSIDATRLQRLMPEIRWQALD